MAEFWLGSLPQGPGPLATPGQGFHVGQLGPCSQYGQTDLSASSQVMGQRMHVPYPQDLQVAQQQQQLMQLQHLEQMANRVSGLFRPEQQSHRPHAAFALPVEACWNPPSSATVVDVLTLGTVRAVFPMTVAETLSANAAARAFQRFGEVVGLDMQRCRSKGEVIVTFSEPKAAQKLLLALTPEKVLDCTDSANEFMPTVERAGEILESLSSTNEQSQSTTTSPSAKDRPNPFPGEVPDYATLLAPTPGRLPTPFRGDQAKEVRESAHQFIPERIAQGLDFRTSIILGGLPKTCSAERFLHSMKSCHLITKLRFFYLPVEKTRGRAVGYIFMDFQHASDVLDFWTRLRELCEGIGGPKALQNLYVSYSLIQGRDQLLEHFGGSDIMFEPDANKRPQFFFPQD